MTDPGKLLPCRECGAACEIVPLPEYANGNLWVCSKHPKLGGDCPSDQWFTSAEEWNIRPQAPTPEELLPCPLPWCGGDAQRNYGKIWKFIECSWCGTEGPQHKTEAEARAAWNTRPQPPAPQDDTLVFSQEALVRTAQQIADEVLAPIIAERDAALAKLVTSKESTAYHAQRHMECFLAQRSTEAKLAAAEAALRKIADGIGKCGTCGEVALSGCTDCDCDNPYWVPQDAKEVALGALAKEKNDDK